MRRSRSHRCRGAAGHPTDLRAPHAQPVVVELLAEPDLAASARVERQVDDGALGSQDSQRRCQCARLPAALEDYVGSTVAGSVAPSGLQYHGRVSILDAERLQAQPLSDPAARWRGIQDDDRGGAVVVCQQSGHQADNAGSNHCDATPPNAVGEAAHIAAVQICAGVQQSVRADGSHVGGVNAKHRFEFGWQSDEPVCPGVGPISAAVPVGHSE